MNLMKTHELTTVSMHLKLPHCIRHVIKASSFWQDNHLILREIRHFPRFIILTVIFSISAAIFEGFGIGFLFGFLQNLVNTGSEIFQTGIEWIDVPVLGKGLPANERLIRICGLILVSTWIRVSFTYLAAVHAEWSRIKLVDRLYKSVFEQVQALSLSFFGKTRSGDIINVVSNEISQLTTVIIVCGSLLTRVFIIPVYIFVLLHISWQLSLIAVFMFSLIATAVARLNLQIREASFPVVQARQSFLFSMVELINGIRTVKGFAAQEFEQKRAYQASNEIARRASKAILGLCAVRPLSEGLATTGLISMIIFGMTTFVVNNALQPATFLTFLFVLFRLVPILNEVNGSFGTISNYQGSIFAVTQFLNPQDKPYLKNGTVQFIGLQQAIEFVAVDFGYDSKSLVLQDITLTIEKGQTVALVGASGAGKSTLADLLPRFYDPTRGTIYFDGVDLKTFDVQSLRRRMAIVSQDTFIFNTSVRNNIAYGLEVIDDSAVIKAARMANALEFIQQLPEGFDTVLGDRGVRLSGGQRQRIAIARALLRNPEILILDEATSALDSVSERLIQESLEKLSTGRTVIAIAHRLSTIVRSDKVVVLEKGQIVEQGTYQELLVRKGKLWNYHLMQSGIENLTK